MIVTPQAIKHYHVFLASPGDVNEERQIVRRFFERYNRTAAQLWGVHFDVVDWENYSSIGVGHPQELITKQTLERFKDSLALVVGIMAQRFGSPTRVAESGTEEEFRWALSHHQQYGFPEIKWFFRRIDQFVAPPDLEKIEVAMTQWKKVRHFREELKAIPMYIAEYANAESFKEVFENDVSRWLSDPARPWVGTTPLRNTEPSSDVKPPQSYYLKLERDFQRLDIAGIDNDRTFEIPLSDIYVRLRVMFDEDSQNNREELNTDAIDIQTALLQYPKLVIVGDPGSGKSTFLKYVALMLARSILQDNPVIALDKLCIQPPLPIPIFISSWDLSDFLREQDDAQVDMLLSFVSQRLNKQGFPVTQTELESILNAGSGCLLFDGLDEVPTDAGRAVISRLLEECVKQFPANRYVVTSRVRAYTGDTILKGEFARCDIQPFDAHERAQFLKNWSALLFKTSSEQVLLEGSDANREFQSLTESIESNDRIRPLAVNPLLLTVIAIVHWNRKRLPEQRVDLYDECVDVLLGQRKEAEQIQSRRKAAAFDEQIERRQEEERPWLRKRFAEIALRILESEGKSEEASKSEIIKLLAPRFLDRGARTQEEAEIQAARFLDKQEVSSGLLVSRKEHSYRFVHLTFQEYLAAWHLSNQDFDMVPPVIEPRLREQRWFEPLQLLGGEWAKQSDEKLNRYLQWLLARQGTTILERAPVVALCANVVKDTTGVAELTPNTRKAFERAVEDTLDAFRPRSGVPVLTQIEILEALGRLGAPVKSHLVDATKSGLFQVRSLAIDMLLPHLTDDELFSMGHLMADRSKEPIKTYLLSMLSRDPQRTVHWLSQRDKFSEKATEAFVEVLYDFKRRVDQSALHKIATGVFTNGRSYYSDALSASRVTLVEYLTDASLQASATQDPEPGVRATSLSKLVQRQAENLEIWNLIHNVAAKDRTDFVRINALQLLANGAKDDPRTWELMRAVATQDQHINVRIRAVQLLLKQQGQLPEIREIASTLMTDSDTNVRKAAFAGIIQQPDFAYATGLFLSLSNWIHPWDQGILIPHSWRFFSAFDPRKAITNGQVELFARGFKLQKTEIKERYERLQADLQAKFGLQLKLEWQEVGTDQELV